jgi:protein subunit release factor B
MPWSFLTLGKIVGITMPLDEESILEECQVAYFLSSGPGGQRRDRKRTAVRLVHEPTGIVVVSGRRRSRTQNLRLALEKLIERIEEKNRPAKPRIKTKKPKRVKEAILKQKKRLSAKKKLRKKVAVDDD